MKIFIATRAGQGLRKSDFNHCNEGEWLMFSFICDTDKPLIAEGRIDEGCGCGRSMDGIASGKATTTFTVTDEPITIDDLAKAIKVSYLNGWGGDFAAHADCVALAKELVEKAAPFYPHQVLEKRGHEIVVRMSGKLVDVWKN